MGDGQGKNNETIPENFVEDPVIAHTIRPTVGQNSGEAFPQEGVLLKFIDAFSDTTFNGVVELYKLAGEFFCEKNLISHLKIS